MDVDSFINGIADRLMRAADPFAAGVVESIRGTIGETGEPSEPGQPPKRQSGQLYEGVQARPPQRNGDIVSVEVVSTAPHSSDLEHGRPNMAPRPFMEPARLAAQADWQRTQRDAANGR